MNDSRSGGVNKCPVRPARGSIPVELGKVVICLYISLALDHKSGKVRGVEGPVPIRNVKSSGLRHPNGLFAFITTQSDGSVVGI